MKKFWERVADDPWLYAMRLIGLFLVLLLVVTLLGCAQTRYLTAEEDAKMREVCGGENRDCAVLSGDEWRALQHFLKKFGIEI